jgi:multimeric flavodoxin WrbA
MKTLIINGSPRESGDTAALLEQLRRRLNGDIAELSAYRADITPCLDCRACRTAKGCVIDDDMRALYADDFDNVVVASPVYYSLLPGPMLSLASRFQPMHNAMYFLGDPIKPRPKRGGLILTAGGKGNESGALRIARVLFKMMNATGFEEHTVISKNTDTLPASEDTDALEGVGELANWLNDTIHTN